MKVLQIIPDLPTGGAEMVVLTYLRLFKEDRDIEMSLISLSPNKSRLYERMALSEDLPISYLNQDIDDNSLASRIKQVLQLRTAIKSVSPDVIHFHLSIVWIVCLAIVGLKIKALYHTLHSNPSKTSVGKNRYVDMFLYKLFSIRTICLNEEMKSIADRIFLRSDTVVIPNGIDIKQYQSNCRREYRDMFGLSDSDFVLGHVGRFCKVKNHPKIIEVFKIVKNIKNNSKLLLIGDGEEQEIIKTLCVDEGVIDDVLFLGTRNDVPKVMQTFDTFVFPSFYEGLGIVLIEAQASGLPCVISSTIPSEAIVSNHVIKLPLDSDSAVWADAIINPDSYMHEEKSYSIDYYDISNVKRMLHRLYLSGV